MKHDPTRKPSGRSSEILIFMNSHRTTVREVQAFSSLYAHMFSNINIFLYIFLNKFAGICNEPRIKVSFALACDGDRDAFAEAACDGCHVTCSAPSTATTAVREGRRGMCV